MIKISKFVYIHYLTIVLFVICYITRSLETVAFIYLTMVLHEIAHLIAAIYLKCGISHIVLYPFGVNLKIKSRLLSGVCEDFILYFSGPLVNAVLALLCLFMGRKGIFYYNNILLFILNLLPIMPLDGGQILKRILRAKMGEKNSTVLMNIISAVISLSLLTLFFITKSITVNTIIFSIFIIACVFSQKPKYSIDLARELMLASSRKTPLNTDLLMVSKNDKSYSVLRKINPSKGAVLMFVDEKGKIKKFMTDKEYTEKILNTDI